MQKFEGSAKAAGDSAGKEMRKIPALCRSWWEGVGGKKVKHT